MPVRRRHALLAASAAAGALLLTGCGSSAPEATVSLAPAAAVEQAVASTSAVTSTTFTGTLTAGGEAITMEGTVATGTPARASFTSTMGGKQVETRVIGSQIYIKLGDTSPIPGAQGKTWLKLDLADSTALGSLGLGSLTQQADQSDPRKLLEMLRASGEVTRVGTETVAGKQTTHYRGSLDLNRLPSSVPSELRAQLKEQLLGKAGVKDVMVDAWIADDGLPVKIRQSMDSAAGSVAVEFVYSGYNEPVDVQAPPAAETFDASALLGALDSLGS